MAVISDHIDRIDDATLLIHAVEAIAATAIEEGCALKPATSAALFWGLAHLAREAREALNPEVPQ